MSTRRPITAPPMIIYKVMFESELPLEAFASEPTCVVEVVGSKEGDWVGCSVGTSVVVTADNASNDGRSSPDAAMESCAA